MIILGIDPGLRVSGYGILKKEGQKLYLLDFGALTLSSKDSVQVRVGQFAAFYAEKIKQYSVTCVALETPFLGKNPQSFLTLGYARGVLYYLAHQHNLSVQEYSPMQVKKAITGFGGAKKEQVAQVMGQLFPMVKNTKKLDITDALAVTLCASWQQRFVIL